MKFCFGKAKPHRKLNKKIKKKHFRQFGTHWRFIWKNQIRKKKLYILCSVTKDYQRIENNTNGQYFTSDDLKWINRFHLFNRRKTNNWLPFVWRVKIVFFFFCLHISEEWIEEWIIRYLRTTIEINSKKKKKIVSCKRILKVRFSVHFVEILHAQNESTFSAHIDGPFGVQCTYYK